MALKFQPAAPRATSPAGAPAGLFVTDPATGLVIGQADGSGNTVNLGSDEVNIPWGPISANTTIKNGPAKFLSIRCNVAGTFTLRNGAHTVGAAVDGFTAVSMVPGDPPRTFGFPIDLVNGFGLDVSGGGSFSGLMR